MPWHVVSDSADCPSSKPFAVVVNDTGDLAPGGCHETKQQALDHMRALYKNAEAGDTVTTREMLARQGWTGDVDAYRGFGTKRRGKAEKAFVTGFARALRYVERRVEQAVRTKATTLVAAPVALNPQDVYNPSWWRTGVRRYVTPKAADFYDEVSQAIADQLGVDPIPVEDQSDDLDGLEALALMYGGGQESWVIDQVTAAMTDGGDLTGLTESLTSIDGKFGGNWAENFGSQLMSQVWNIAALATAAAAGRALTGEPPQLDDNGQVINPDESTATSYTPDQLQKRWLSQRDERVRDAHEITDDDVAIPLDEDFDVGGYPAARPGDPRLPVEQVANCFPANTPVSVPSALLGGYRRYYSGPLVEIETAGGAQLSATPNHPVLTRRGWVPIGAVQPGDEVVRYLGGSDCLAVRGSYEQDRPAPIGQVLEALYRQASVGVRVDGAAVDFHGDRPDGDVDVVRADGPLLLSVQAEDPEGVSKFRLTPAYAGLRSVAPDRTVLQLLDAARAAAASDVRGAGELASAGAVQPGHATGLLLSTAPDRDLLAGEPVDEDRPVDAALVGEALGWFPVEVAADVFPRVARSAPCLAGVGASHAGLSGRPDVDVSSQEAQHLRVDEAAGAGDLQGGGAVQVVLDEVLIVRQSEWSGHVYNLETVAGWYVAGSIVSQNCRCVLEISKVTGEGDEIVLSIDQIDQIDPELATATEEEGGMTAAGALRAEVDRWNGNVTPPLPGQPIQLHTHGKCRRCGGYLTGTNNCEKCGSGYHGPAADGQPTRPSERYIASGKLEPDAADTARNPGERRIVGGGSAASQAAADTARIPSGSRHPSGGSAAAVVLPTTVGATMTGGPVDAGLVAPGGVSQEDQPMPVSPDRANGAAVQGELVPWRGIIAVEGRLTGDRRLFAENSLWWDERYLPFDLFVMTRDPEGGQGHDGSEIGGRVDKLWRQAAGGYNEIWAEGVYDTSTPAGLKAATLQSKNMLKGVSIDVDSVEQIESLSAGHVDIPGNQRTEAYSKGRIRRITVCSIPAFIEARISPVTADTEVIPGLTPVAAAGKRLAFQVKFNPGGCVGHGDKTDQWAVMDGNKVVDCFPTRAEAVDAQAKVNAQASTQRQFQVGDTADVGDALHIVVRDDTECGADRPWSVVAPDGSVVACFEGRYDAYEAARDLDEDQYGDEGGDEGGEGDEDESVQVVIVSSGTRRKAPMVDKLRVWTPVQEFGDDAADQRSLVASGAAFSSSLVETDPPAEIFRQVAYNEFTPATIDAEGRISGHITPHGECHISYTNKCVVAPRSRDGYRYARAGGHVLCAGGEMVPTARIFAQFTPGRRAHAPENTGAEEAKQWYENQCAVVADVAMYDDNWGIQVQGRVRPGITRHQLVAFRASDVSPDWRTIRGKYECVALACVNVSGFPSRYDQLPALVASGAEHGVPVDVPEEAEMVGSAWIVDGRVRTLIASAAHREERSSNLVLMSAIERMACRVEELEQAELARQAEQFLADVPTEDEVQAELEALVASAMAGVPGVTAEAAEAPYERIDESPLSEAEVDALHALLVRLADGQRPPRRCDGCGARMSYDQNYCPSCGGRYNAATGTFSIHDGEWEVVVGGCDAGYAVVHAESGKEHGCFGSAAEAWGQIEAIKGPDQGTGRTTELTQVPATST